MKLEHTLAICAGWLGTAMESVTAQNNNDFDAAMEARRQWALGKSSIPDSEYVPPDFREGAQRIGLQGLASVVFLTSLLLGGMRLYGYLNKPPVIHSEIYDPGASTNNHTLLGDDTKLVSKRKKQTQRFASLSS